MKKYYIVYVFLMLSMFCVGGSLGVVQGGFLALVTIFFFIITLAVIGCQDMKFMRISDKWNVILLGIAVFSCVTIPEISFSSRLMGLICVSGPLLAIALLVPGSFGGGDIKMMAAGGLFLGWKAALVSASAGMILGGIWAGGQLVMGKMGRKDCFPLGSFLCLGMAFGVYAGNPLAEYFFHL